MDSRYADCWFAVDGTNLVFKDVCTGDITGSRFRRRLECLNRQWMPERIIVAFDPDDGTSFRRDLYANYKSNRGPKPEGLEHAIESAKRACYDECVDCVTVSTFEADDVLATVVNGALMVDRRVVLFSSDKDLRQLLLAGRVTQCTQLSRTGDRLNGEFLTERDMAKLNDDGRPVLGALAEQWIEYQTLRGDPGDKVPGVRGIGEEHAAELLSRYGTIDNLCQQAVKLAKVPMPEKKVLAAREDGTLDLMRELVTLRSDVPISAAMMEMEVPA
ncbi:5'-3' exonuclease [Neorhodopirellula pilleata]|uniref:DNA polymerase I, thermostable n=1 Tax=Neorhodopirellula pilleata TaxID=2714738 RepID=A0A5C5ZWR8_9BACT|nr:5'-3' exonuclease H3TH domain-containing protein [Neorhodopirellula pilleata]TWT91422.1 DNA polymerase I, thermostable [Neorhodopirellula pilleata]TWT91471.1 DNA polymerase I, thermostable [Neorhodopirellula pilleata]